MNIRIADPPQPRGGRSTSHGQRRWLTMLAVLGMLLLGPVRFGQAQDEGGGSQPTSVRVAPVESKQLQDRRRVTGELRAIDRAQVASLEQGRIDRLHVREGQVIAKDDLLAELDNRRLRQQIAQAEQEIVAVEALITAREAQLRREQADLDLLRSLREGGASNPKELLDAETATQIAQAQLDEARADLAVRREQIEFLRIRLADTEIRAPFAGAVITRHVDVGEWLSEGDPVVEIVSTTAYEAWLDVPQRFAGAMSSEGAEVQVSVEATGAVAGPASPTIIRQVDPTARSFQAVIVVEDEADVLSSGMSVVGWVPTGRRGEFLTVPRDAVLRNEAGPFVYVARSQGQGPAMATPVPITVRFLTEDAAAVSPGALQPGDLVVVEGNERLFPMMPIQFEPPAITSDGGPQTTSRRPSADAAALASTIEPSVEVRD